MDSQRCTHSVLDTTNTRSQTTWYQYRTEFSGIAHHYNRVGKFYVPISHDVYYTHNGFLVYISEFT